MLMKQKKAVINLLTILTVEILVVNMFQKLRTFNDFLIIATIYNALVTLFLEN
jgi:hypothetical protein